MHLGPVILPSDIGVTAHQVGGRLEAPTLVVRALGGKIGRIVADLDTVLRAAAEMTERAALRLRLGPLVVEAVLHLQIDRPAQRVETKDWIIGPQIGAIDCVGWDQVPVYGVSERLIEANAVNVEGNPLRRALQR